MNIPKYVELFGKELKLKRYSENTIRNYECCLKLFLDKMNYSEPKKISESAIKEYLTKLPSVSQLKQNIGCLKLFYKFVIRQPLKFKHIEYPRKERRLPEILSHTEVMNMINRCTNLKHKAIIMMLYSAGFRVSELINLKVTDIDSAQMIIRIKKGKGGKDRIVPLSENVLKLLREYWLSYRPVEYLFNGQNALQYSAGSIRAILKQNSDKHIYPHLLRHSCFSQMLASGGNLRDIQNIAGHNSIKTTTLYIHTNNEYISRITTPV